LINALSDNSNLFLNVSQGKAEEEQERFSSPLTKARREVSPEYLQPQQPHWVVTEDMEQITQRARKYYQSYRAVRKTKEPIHWPN